MQARLRSDKLEQRFPLLCGRRPRDSRYCVDGVLCRTPEELFDLLLQDYWDFELIRRTQGRREATAADEEAVDELCQPYLDWRKEALK